MTSSFQASMRILSREVGYLFWVWMNLEKSREQQLFWVNLYPNCNKNFIGLQFSENVFHWSKFKLPSHGIFFSWTFDLLLINSSRYSHKSQKYLWIQTSKETNPEIKTSISTRFFHEIKTNVCFCWKSSWTTFIFSQFHDLIFRSSRLQMFFEIAALKDFTIF